MSETSVTRSIFPVFAERYAASTVACANAPRDGERAAMWGRASVWFADVSSYQRVAQRCHCFGSGFLGRVEDAVEAVEPMDHAVVARRRHGNTGLA